MPRLGSAESAPKALYVCQWKRKIFFMMEEILGWWVQVNTFLGGLQVFCGENWLICLRTYFGDEDTFVAVVSIVNRGRGRGVL